MSTQKKTKKGARSERLSAAKLQKILETIAELNQNISDRQHELDEYYKFLKERGINVTVLKQVAKIWESDIKPIFADYWEKYTEAESNLPQPYEEEDEEDGEDGI